MSGFPEMKPEICCTALDQLSYAAVVGALDNDEEVVVNAVRERILYYTALAGEALRDGEDYLAILRPNSAKSALERVALEIVLDVFEEKLAEE